MIIFPGLLLAFFLISVILAPFFFGKGGLLLPSAAITDQKKILEMKEIVLNQYIKDETAKNQKQITKTEWEKRREFLTNRYLDLSRQYDFLHHSQKTAKTLQAEQD